MALCRSCFTAASRINIQPFVYIYADQDVNSAEDRRPTRATYSELWDCSAAKCSAPIERSPTSSMRVSIMIRAAWDLSRRVIRRVRRMTFSAAALVALSRLEHRGATASDGKSSDGVGIATALPRAFFLESAGVSLAADETLGVGTLFLPANDGIAEAVLDRCLAAHGFRVLCWA